MSVTALVWAITLAVLVVLALRRPVYGLSAYLLTYFMFPKFWWWGDDLPSLRWNLLTGIVLVVATAIHRARIRSDAPVIPGAVWALLALLALNATFVHFVLAPDRLISADSYTLMMKFTLLLVLMAFCIEDRSDFRIAMWSMVLGAAYIGYEVTINDRGSLSGARLEGIGAAGVQNANQLASLMATLLPLTGALFLVGSWREKIGAVVVAPLILNVLLLCNSRGAFLATIAGGVVYVIVTGGPARKKATRGLALGGLAIFLLLGDPAIVERFTSIFVSSEERDNSANSRLIFWRAGLEMLADRPLGSGGESFAQVYGARYLGTVQSRPVHNGFITEAVDWGVQGFALRMLLLGVGSLIGWRVLKARKAAGDVDAVILGACLLTGMAAYLGTAVFGDFIDEEWGYWMLGLLLVYARLYATAPDAAARPIDRQVAAWAPAGAARGSAGWERTAPPTPDMLGVGRLAGSGRTGPR
jgi:O-antigen ligase